MIRTSFVVMLVLVAGFATVSQAGWHHRHAGHQAAPAYYMMPAYAPAYAPMQAQSAPSAQNALGDIIIAKLVDKLIGSIDKVDIGSIRPKREEPGDNGSTPTPTTTDLSALQQELRELKASVKDLDARVENANSALQVHGKHLLAIQEKLEELKGDLDGSSDIGKAAHKILTTKTLDDIEEALKKPEFNTAAEKYKKADEATTPKALDDLRAAVKGLLKP